MQMINWVGQKFKYKSDYLVSSYSIEGKAENIIERSNI